MTYFYRDHDGGIVCTPCAKPCSARCNDCYGDELEPIHLTNLMLSIPEGIFKCVSCEEKFIVYDGLAFKQVHDA